MENIIAGMRSFGVRAMPLNNTELIELFFDLYNPGETSKQFLLSENIH